MGERERILRGLHLVLAHLHLALAENRRPEPRLADIADSLSAWWSSRAALPMGEAIVAAAHLYRLDGSEDPRAVPTIVSAPPPARHHNLFALAGKPDESGFLTSSGRFVGREEALRIASRAGQALIDHPGRHARQLFSEDLW